jgi:hypothetical protein
MALSDDAPRVAEVFAIGIGECGSNLVGAYQPVNECFHLVYEVISA